MKEYIAAEYQAALNDRGLDNFEGLWSLELPTVDQPNTERGGWSSVCRLEMEVAGKSVGFYLKRQNNHCSHTWLRPFGEPTFAREFRSIRHYHNVGLPAPEVAYFAERKVKDGKQSILMTRALDDFCPLSEILPSWSELAETVREQVLDTIGTTVAKMHGERITHHCLYPKHIFINLSETLPKPELTLIDLEKARFQLFSKRERVADLEALLRRADLWTERERERLLSTYVDSLPDAGSVSDYQRLLQKRNRKKLKGKKVSSAA